TVKALATNVIIKKARTTAPTMVSTYSRNADFGARGAGAGCMATLGPPLGKTGWGRPDRLSTAGFPLPGTPYRTVHSGPASALPPTCGRRTDSGRWRPTGPFPDPPPRFPRGRRFGPGGQHLDKPPATATSATSRRD